MKINRAKNIIYKGAKKSDRDFSGDEIEVYKSKF